MQVEIDFRAESGKTQTLFANMTDAEYDRYTRLINDPREADRIVYISSRVKKNGPTNEWMFEVGRITLRKV
jgi:hypothetical protein